MLIASATYACHLIESLCGLCSGCVFWSDMWLCVISLLAPWAVWGIVFNPCCPPLPCRCIRQCSISVNLENMLTNSPAALSVRISEAEAINCWSVPYRYIFQGLWSFPSVLVTLVPLSLSLTVWLCFCQSHSPPLHKRSSQSTRKWGKEIGWTCNRANIPGYY